MNKKTKMTLIIVLSVVVIAVVLLVPFVTLNIDDNATFGDFNKVTVPVRDAIQTWNDYNKDQIKTYLKTNFGITDSGCKIYLYMICNTIGISSEGCSDYTISDSTTDTFDLVYNNGKKISNVKLNVKKLFATLGNQNGNTFPVKTNLLHTMYLL